MKIEAFAADKQLVSEYQKWIKSDVGILVLSVLRETFLRPIQPGQIGQMMNQHTAAYCLGENSGAWKIVEALEGLASFEVSNDEVVSEDYGNSNTKQGEVNAR